jgi:UDP-N-acetylmuramyl pentapeptide synthase
MISALASVYRPAYLRILVYMLQGSEYQTGPYLRWFWRTQNFSTVMKRRSLEPTKAARLLLMALRVGVMLQISAGLVLIYLGARHNLAGGVAFGAALVLAYPVVCAHLVVMPLVLGRVFISQPAERKLVTQSRTIFAAHKGIKIAVAGSYGKTTMKELLLTVLGHGLRVAATPANKNVSVSHAYFARKLTGDEDVLVIEYGEGAPGDIARFAAITQPTHAIITGLAPAHLDQYKTLQAAGEDIFSLAEQVAHEKLFVSTDSPSTQPFLMPDFKQFNSHGALSWKVTKLETSVHGTTFTMTKGKQKLALRSGLVGKHQAGFLVLVAALALQLGLTEAQVKAGVAATKPFEHRMQPYSLGGAWIIDDTYNGNLEGIRVGTQLLADLSASARRTIYVSPGLVDQGDESEQVHTEMGQLIAVSKPDLVVLMQNSVTAFIVAGLEGAAYKGELHIETKPLEFYTNLKHFVAAGDVVVMQNDWTDNYA